MKFSEILQSMQGSGGEWTARAGEDWLQGRTLFGGLQAALAVRAMRGLLGGGAPLRTLQLAFIAPIPAGEVRLRARVLREGKNATQVEARIVEGDATVCLAIGIFGATRASAVRRLPAPTPVEQPDNVPFRFVQGITPAFTQHFRSTWLRGGLPFAGGSDPHLVVQMDLLDSATAASEYHALAIADLIPPIALSWLKTPAPGATMTWMIEFLASRFDALPLNGWRIEAEMLAAGEGYTSQAVTIFGPGGVAVAQSQQSMVVFG